MLCQRASGVPKQVCGVPWLCEAQHDAEIHEATECSSNTAGGVEVQGRGRAAAARSELPASLPSARSQALLLTRRPEKHPPLT